MRFVHSASRWGKGMLAIDPSLTCSGYAYWHEDQLAVGRIMPKSLRGVQRLKFIKGTFTQLVGRAEPEILVLEGYSMGSRTGKTFDIGELGGMFKLEADYHGMTTLIVSPSTLKKWVTGKGNADKKQMKAAVRKRWKYDFKSDDECDAVALLYFGEFYFKYKNRRRKSPEIREMLAKCVVEEAS